MHRPDFVLIGQVIRTHPMTLDERHELANAFANALHTVPGFDPDKFVHEATRGARAGEQPTADITDYWLRIRPTDLDDAIEEQATSEAERVALHSLSWEFKQDTLNEKSAELGLNAETVAHNVLGRTIAALREELAERAERRDRTPGAWALSESDPNAPYGPFPDEPGRTAKQAAADYLVTAGKTVADYRIVFRRG